jgi:Leucine-rich repeat (LRR) protein
MKIFGLVIFVAAASLGGFFWYSAEDGSVVSPETKEVSKTYSEAVTKAKEISEEVMESVGTKVEVYKGISVSDSSTTLDLSGQKLTGSLKAEVRLITSLVELNLADNDFTGIPAEIGQLSELRILNLSGNPVTGLPYELGNLQKLEVLDLRNTSYAKADLEVIKAKLPKSTTILVD